VRSQMVFLERAHRAEAGRRRSSVTSPHLSRRRRGLLCRRAERRAINCAAEAAGGALESSSPAGWASLAGEGDGKVPQRPGRGADTAGTRTLLLLVAGIGAGTSASGGRHPDTTRGVHDMAQNERQGVGTEKDGTASKTGAGSSAPTGGETGSEQGRVEVGASGTVAGQEQQGGRTSRRAGWDDPITSFFGGSPFALFRRLSDDMDRIFFGAAPARASARSADSAAGSCRTSTSSVTTSWSSAPISRASGPRTSTSTSRTTPRAQGERRTQQEENRGGLRRSSGRTGASAGSSPPPGANTGRPTRGSRTALRSTSRAAAGASRRLEVHRAARRRPAPGETTRH
jgi:hypothetical protein